MPQHIYNLLVAFMNENLINADYTNNDGYPLCIEAVGILSDVARSLSYDQVMSFWSKYTSRLEEIVKAKGDDFELTSVLYFGLTEFVVKTN